MLYLNTVGGEDSELRELVSCQDCQGDYPRLCADGCEGHLDRYPSL